ncbi:YjjG family noncanonical pyrimidine nucleotidase [Arenibacter sp. GZD96]|uniref:YjjG family noncanonical pyrimidine nucleotidase n=1 Tax=Aurantibrevibacter litoralis TaxID=3106030 RepID=UPI002AFF66F2|nr:YjjG family noncanonical pyrimidine nucleotidase [Arenibacter sp. GZD-96]MEA1785906.1 YjjG family noncanonical pyrimidine nucleotidase [Arenibacter sp. GZD-96]
MFKGIVTDVFFDLDHTLWDFEKNSALTFKKILAEANITVKLADFLEVYKPINLELWKLYRENRISQADLRYKRLKQTFDVLGHTMDSEQINALAGQYIVHLSTFPNLLPNTHEILRYLKPNYKLHIITNGFQEIQYKKLQNSQIDIYFDRIIHSETVGVKKPHPKIFEIALEKSKVLPKNAIMIGDSLEADILGAKAVGLHTLHFNVHGDPKHDFSAIIFDLIEIKNYL